MVHFPEGMKAPDQNDVTRQVLGQVLTHPVTWGPFLPIAAAYAFLGAAWWLCLILALAAAVVVFLAWSSYAPRLMKAARADLLASHRVVEDSELAARVQRLALTTQLAGKREVLDALREALGTKRAVEQRILADGVVTDREQEVSTLVGDLVRTMVEQAERLAGTEGAPASANERFQKAAATLRQVSSEIDVVLDPVPEELRAPAEDDALARASERLDDQLKLARGIRQHLERDLSAPDASARQTAPRPREEAEN